MASLPWALETPEKTQLQDYVVSGVVCEAAKAISMQHIYLQNRYLVVVLHRISGQKMQEGQIDV